MSAASTSTITNEYLEKKKQFNRFHHVNVN